MKIEDLINDLVENRPVDTTDLQQIFAELCDGVSYPTEQLAAMLVLLRTRGENAEQLAGIAEVLLQRALPVEIPSAAVCLCGTGGDNSGSFNISTTASLLVAACGIPVAKHGSRSITSKSGSADVLEALGIATDLGPEQAKYSLENYGFTFLAAQVYHPTFKHISPVRQALKVRTIFNIMGPLLHPGHLKRQLIGVFEPGLLDTLAGALSRLGHVKTLVVCTDGKLDEISLTGITAAKLVEGERITDIAIDPRDYGFSLCSLDDIRGGDAGENASISRAIFAGEKGPRSDCIILNSGVAIYLSGKTESIEEGIRLARSVQESGSALAYVEKLQEIK